MKCIVCGRNIEDFEEMEEHHISYPVRDFPELKVPIHKRCHKIIHSTDHYPGLKPRRGHSTLYYNGKENTDDNYVDDEIVYFKEDEQPNFYSMIPEYDQIDWYKLVNKFYKYHQEQNKTDERGRPVIELSPGKGKEPVEIPLSLNNLAKLFGSNKMTVSRKIKD